MVRECEKSDAEQGQVKMRSSVQPSLLTEAGVHCVRPKEKMIKKSLLARVLVPTVMLNDP